MSHIFISYSRKDIEIASSIVQALADNALETWIDWKNIPKGEDWEQEIYRGIEEADAFIFLISLDSVTSKMCNKEIAHAIKNNKRILPIFITSVEVEAIKDIFLYEKQKNEIFRRNLIFYRNGQEDFNKVIEEVSSTIHSDYGWLKYHRELQVKALKWEQKNDTSRLLRGKELIEAEQLLTEVSSKKDPQPTTLQRQYILSSRRNEEQQRRRIVIGLSLGLIITVALSIFAWLQRNEAKLQQATAQAASTRAIAQEYIANTNAAEAQLQSNIALARQFAAQSTASRSQNFPLSLLLGIEAYRKFDTVQIKSVLLDNIETHPQLLHYFFKHKSPVSSVAFNPDGKMFASGSTDNSIILWDVATGQPIGQPLIKHTDWVSSVAFSPDGKILASGSYDKTIILWDIATRQPIGQPLTGHTASAFSVAISSDGKTLASGSADGSIILWDIATHKIIGQPLRGNANSVNSVAFSPDGKILASGNYQNSIILWDVAAQKPIGQPLTGHTSTVWSVSFSPDGKTLASGSADGNVILWDVATRQPIGSPLTEQGFPVFSVAFSPDGRTLASSSCGGTYNLNCNKGKIILRDLATLQIIGEPLTDHTDTVFSVAFSPDGKTFVSGSRDNSVILWSVTKSQLIGQLLMQNSFSTLSLAFSSDGKTFASGGSDKSIILWNLITRQPIGLPLVGHTSDVYSLVFSPDEKTLASGSCSKKDLNNTCVQGEIILWNVETHQPISQPLIGLASSIKSLAFSPDGKILASGGCAKSDSVDNCIQGEIILWDVETHQPIGQPLMEHTGWVSSVAFSPDRKTLVSGSADKSIIFWNVETRQPIGQPLTEHIAGVVGIRNIAFDLHGEILAVVMDTEKGDSIITLWDVATRTSIGQPLTGHTSWINNIVFSPDGKILASGSDDSSIILWDMTTRQSIGQPLYGHDIFSVLSLAFSPDGKLLASGSDFSIMLWSMVPSSWVDKTCQRVGRNFSRSEWVQYFYDKPYPTKQIDATCPQWPLDVETTLAPLEP